MSGNEIIEIVRRILNDAVNNNLSSEAILEISEKLDEYIVDYYNNNEEMKGKEKNEKERP